MLSYRLPAKCASNEQGRLMAAVVKPVNVDCVTVRSTVLAAQGRARAEEDVVREMDRMTVVDFHVLREVHAFEPHVSAVRDSDFSSDDRRIPTAALDDNGRLFCCVEVDGQILEVHARGQVQRVAR